jgi:hypothetical protein
MSYILQIISIYFTWILLPLQFGLFPLVLEVDIALINLLILTYGVKPIHLNADEMNFIKLTAEYVL